MAYQIEGKRGFTLVEMLIVVAILILFPLIIIPNFPQIRDQFALSRVAFRFAQDVRRAQEMSLSSEAYYDQSGTQQAVSGYGIYLDPVNLGPTKYLLYADRYPGNQQYDPLDYTVEAIDFSGDEPGVVIKEVDNVFGSGASVNFSPPKPNTLIATLNTGQTEMDVVFALSSDPTKTKTVSINAAGLVEVR